MSNGQGGLQLQPKALWLKYSRKHPAVCCERGIVKSHGIYFRLFLMYALQLTRLGVGMGLSAHSARSRGAASRVHPIWGVVW